MIAPIWPGTLAQAAAQAAMSSGWQMVITQANRQPGGGAAIEYHAAEVVELDESGVRLRLSRAQVALGLAEPARTAALASALTAAFARPIRVAVEW